VEHRYNPIHRRYEYDPAGELVRTLDKLRGETRYSYQANGQLRSRDTGSILSSEEFRYDAAGNRLDFNARQFARVTDNRIAKWRNCEYRYDAWGNLIEKFSGPATEQRFEYDCENRLVKAETFVAGKLTATGHYSYDSLGRRVAKRAEVDGRVELKRFLWQGLRMLSEETPGQNILYLYEPVSYAPLARIDQVEGEESKIYYFHNDQIGTPCELTNDDGEIVWQATYRGWGEVEESTNGYVEQNIRFQGQYFDCETSFCCCMFRYYDAGAGRFITQDPVGLSGGINFYRYAPNSAAWVDPLGLAYKSVSFEGSPDLFPVSGNQKNIVEIQLQGSRARDFTEAFKQAGLKKSQVEAVGKYTWHHLDDFDPLTGKGTMQLVKQSAHVASLPHVGSVSQFEKHFGLRSGAYNTSEAIAISQEKGWLKGRPLKISSTSC